MKTATDAEEAIMEEPGLTTVVVRCPECGQVRVSPRDVTIRNCVDDDTWSYWFVCPACQRRAASPTRRSSALDAICAGSALDTWALPSELEERPDGEPLTLVDLLQLRLILIEPDWLDQLQ
jgi:hypothetical protein